MQAYQADSFVDSIGVGTHLTYTDTNYFYQWPAVLSALQSLGVRHARDGYYNWAPGQPFYQEHQQLAASGITTNYVMPYNTTTTAAEVANFQTQVTDMESVEGSNECDLPNDCGSPTTATQSLANLLSFMPTVDASGQAAGVPVVGPSFTQPPTYPLVGNIGSEMNYNNLHVYFYGHNPGTPGWGSPDAEGNAYGSIQFWLDLAAIDGPNLPVMFTESGYVMQPTPVEWSIPPSTGASYLPRTLLLDYMAGVKRTYIYELLDEKSSPGYGLIDGNMNPKPAYYAIQNLISTLSDKGASFTPATLGYTLTGGDSTLQQILFQKRDGSFYLVTWLEQPSWDPVNLVPTPVTPQSLTLQVNSNYQVSSIGTIDDTGNLIWNSGSGSSQSFSVSDLVTVVKIVPGTSN